MCFIASSHNIKCNMSNVAEVRLLGRMMVAVWPWPFLLDHVGIVSNREWQDTSHSSRMAGSPPLLSLIPVAISCALCSLVSCSLYSSLWKASAQTQPKRWFAAVNNVPEIFPDISFKVALLPSPVAHSLIPAFIDYINVWCAFNWLQLKAAT